MKRLRDQSPRIKRFVTQITEGARTTDEFCGTYRKKGETSVPRATVLVVKS